jgi:predicted deacetylase
VLKRLTARDQGKHMVPGAAVRNTVDGERSRWAKDRLHVWYLNMVCSQFWAGSEAIRSARREAACRATTKREVVGWQRKQTEWETLLLRVISVICPGS